MNDNLLNLLYDLDKEIESQKENYKKLNHLDLIKCKSKVEGLEIAKKLLLKKINEQKSN